MGSGAERSSDPQILFQEPVPVVVLPVSSPSLGPCFTALAEYVCGSCRVRCLDITPPQIPGEKLPWHRHEPERKTLEVLGLRRRKQGGSD